MPPQSEDDGAPLWAIYDSFMADQLASNRASMSGLDRLNLMVSTVLERLTRVEPPASEADV